MTEFNKDDLVKIKGKRGRGSTGKVYRSTEPDIPVVTIIADGSFRTYHKDAIALLTTKIYTGGDRRKTVIATEPPKRRKRSIESGETFDVGPCWQDGKKYDDSEQMIAAKTRKIRRKKI